MQRQDLGNGWRKYSNGSGGACVAIRPTDSGGVELNHSHDLEATPKRFTRDEWIAFTEGVKAGEFDFPVELH